MTMQNDSVYPLDRALPSGMLSGGGAPWSRYRQYPVFSRPWLRGRSLLFALAIGAFAVLTGFGMAATTQDPSIGVRTAAHMFAAFLLMATAGPLLATWVRYRRWPLQRERVGVVVAVLIGIGLSYLADMWASGYVEQVMRATPSAAAASKPQFAPGMRSVLLGVNLVVLALIYGMFGGGLALRAYFSEQRRWRDHRHAQEVSVLREQKQHSDLRLGVLQAQVEPHFLFNTLASVRALVRQDPAQAEATLDALVDHLRATIPKLRDGDGLLHSTLGQQLDICASYLELMRLRTGGRLQYVVEVDASLRALPYPPLLLISLVENAVKHGIEPKSGPGRIELRAARDDGRLSVSVIDDGVGLQPGIGHGVGLSNVRDQLAARYGARASLRLQASPERGTRADVEIPLEDPQ